MKPKLVCSENNVQLAKDLTSKNPGCSYRNNTQTAVINLEKRTARKICLLLYVSFSRRNLQLKVFSLYEFFTHVYHPAVFVLFFINLR